MEIVWGSLKSYKWRSDWHIQFLVVYIQTFLCVLSNNTVLFAWWFSGTGDKVSDSDFERFKGRQDRKGFQKKISWISSIMAMKLCFFLTISFTWYVNKGKQINLFKISSSTSTLIKLITHKYKKKETLEILGNGSNQWLFYFSHFVFPQMTVQRSE